MTRADVTRRLVLAVVVLVVILVCLFIAHRVPSGEGGLLPAGLLLLGLTAMAVRRRAVPRSRWPAQGG